MDVEKQTKSYKRKLRRKRLEYSKLSEIQKAPRDIIAHICQFIVEPFSTEEIAKIDALYQNGHPNAEVYQNVCNVKYVTPDKSDICVVKNGWQLQIRYKLPKLPARARHAPLFNMARTCKHLYRTVKYYRQLVAPKLVAIEKLITMSLREDIRSRTRQYIRNQFNNTKPLMLKHLKSLWKLEPIFSAISKAKYLSFKKLDRLMVLPRDYPSDHLEEGYYPPMLARKDRFQYKIDHLRPYFDIDNAIEICRIDKNHKFGQYTVEKLLSHKSFGLWQKDSGIMSDFKILLFSRLKLPLLDTNKFFIYYKMSGSQYLFMFAVRTN